MKKIILTSMLFLLVLTFASCTTKDVTINKSGSKDIKFEDNKQDNIKIPGIEDIKSIKIEPPTSGALKKDDLFFDLNKKDHLDMINNILKWLKSGEVMPEPGTYPLHGGTPTYLVVELKDGTKIQIESAFDITVNNKPDGTTEITGNRAAGKVTISINNSKNPIIVRELAPELQSFIDSGWKNFFYYHK